MERASGVSSHLKSVLILAGVAAIAAILRYFMQGWVEPLGFPTAAGSLLASVTVVLLVGLVLLFWKEGRSQGRYARAAAWYVAFAVWCEILVIGGILITEQTGAHTYYEGPWEMVHTRFPTPAAHAIAHTQGFLVRLAVGLILGGVVYWVAKKRSGKVTRPQQA